MKELLQLVAVIVGTAAIVLRAEEGTLKKWGYYLGIISVPCWTILEIYYRQWIILPLNILYFWGWFKAYLKWRDNNGK